MEEALPALIGGVLLVILTAGILHLPPLPLAVAVVALFVGTGIVIRPAEAVLGSVGLRMVVDLLWWVDVGPLNAMQAYSGAAVAATCLLIVLGLKEVAQTPVSLPFMLFAGLLAVGTARQPSLDGIAGALKLLGPWTLMLLGPVLLTSFDRVRALLGVMVFASIPAVCVSVVFAATGTRFERVAHAERLLGGYFSVTDHASAMFLFCCLSMYWWFHARGNWRYAAALYGLGALVGLYFSYTRAASLGLVFTVGLYLWLSHRRGLMVAALGGLVLLSMRSVVFSERFGTLFREMQGGGFEDTSRDLGSGRLWIWSTTFAEYLREDVWNIWLGRGVGGHVSPLLQIDPHQEVLSVLYQLGPLGVVAWAWALARCFEAGSVGIQSRYATLSDTARFVFAVVAGCVFVSMITNGFLTRASLAWYFGALLGMMLALGRIASTPETERAFRPVVAD